MNERLKELAKQAGFEWENNTAWVLHDGCWKAESADLERFAELVRQEERAKCAAGYLQDFCGAVNAGMIEEREACAALVEGGNHVHPKAPDAVWAKTVAKLIRARGKPDPAFKNFLDDKWSGIV